jgi:hypothetical protein
MLVFFYCDSYSQKSSIYNKLKNKSPQNDLMYAPKWEDILKKFVNPTELQIKNNKEKYFINGEPFDSISFKENIIYFSDLINNGRRATTLGDIKIFREIDNNLERIYRASEDSVYVGSYSEIVTDPKLIIKIENEEYPVKYELHYEYYINQIIKDSLGNAYIEKCNELKCKKLKSYNKYITLGSKIIDYYNQIDFGYAFYYDLNGKLINNVDFDKGYKKSFSDITYKLSEYNSYKGYVQKILINNKPFWQLHFNPTQKEKKNLVDFTLYINGKTGKILKQKPLIDSTQNLFEKIKNQNNLKILKLSQTKYFLKLLKSTTETIFLKEVIESINRSGRAIQFRNNQQQKESNLFNTGIVLKMNKDLDYSPWFHFEHRYCDNAGGIYSTGSKEVFLNFSNLSSSNEMQNKQLLNRLTKSNFIVQELRYSLNDKIEIKFLGFFEKIVDDNESKNISYTIVFNIEKNETEVSIETTNDYFENKIKKDIILIKK